MAEEEEKQEEKSEEVDEGAKKKKKKLLLFVVIGVVSLLLIITIVVFAFVLTGSDEEAAAGANNAQAVQTQGAKGAGSGRSIDMANIGPMYEMEDFTVNLLNQNGKRYLRTRMAIELDSEDLMSEMDRKTAIIRDIIIQVLSSKQIEEIATIDGKERLKDELVKAVNRLLIDGQVKNVYFTTFVIQ